jgi:hypothetical protein
MYKCKIRVLENVLRSLAQMGMNCGVTHPVTNNAGQPSSCLMVVKFKRLINKSEFYTRINLEK